MFISKGSFDWLLVSILRERTFDIHVEKRPYWIQFYSNLNKMYSAWKASKQRKIRTRKKSVFGHFSHSLWNEVYHHEVTQQTFVLMETSWRRLEDVFRLCLQNTSSRHLDQDEHIHLSHTSSEDVFKTSSRRLAQEQYNRLSHTSSRRLQEFLKTSLKRLQDVFKISLWLLAITSSKHLQDVLQKRLQVIFNTSSRRLAKIPSRRFRNVSSS